MIISLLDYVVGNMRYKLRDIYWSNFLTTSILLPRILMAKRTMTWKLLTDYHKTILHYFMHCFMTNELHFLPTNYKLTYQPTSFTHSHAYHLQYLASADCINFHFLSYLVHYFSKRHVKVQVFAASLWTWIQFVDFEICNKHGFWSRI